MTKFIHGFHLHNLRGDIYGGLTAAVVALPLALAFGVSSGAGPIAGIYGAICVGFFAALFGGTPSQVSGPTGPMTVVMTAIFTQYTGLFPDDPGAGAALAFTVVMMGGAFQILFGFLRLGKFINLIPHPVVSGFMSGIGIIIIMLQIGPLLGHASAGGPLDAAQAIPGYMREPVLHAVLLGLATLIIVYFLPQRINRLLPAPLFALIGGTLGAYFILGGEITQQTIGGSEVYTLGNASVLGDIPTGLPAIWLPMIEPSLLVDMIKSGLTLATLGAIDSLLTSLVADNLTRSHHEPNRELIGQGIGNTFAGMFGGLPGAGATMRTVINVRAGGKTPISGALHALVLLAIVLGAGSFARYIPHAVLAGILIKVGADIIDWDYLKRLGTAPKPGVVMMFTVLLITVLVDLITAVAVGMIMASMVFMQRMVNLQLQSVTAITQPGEEAPLSKVEKELLAEANGRVLLFHLRGPMSFGAAKDISRRMAAFDQYDVLVLDLSDVPHIDFTSCRGVEDMIHDATNRGRSALLVGMKKPVSDALTKQGALRAVPSVNRHEVREQALRQALELIANK